MRPGIYDLDIYRGDSYAWEFTFYEDPEKTQPSDLTGVTVKAEIRDKPSGTTIIELVCGLIEPNVVHMELPAELSRNLPVRGGGWDLQLTYPNDPDEALVVTPLAGRVTVTPDYTDSTVEVTP